LRRIAIKTLWTCTLTFLWYSGTLCSTMNRAVKSESTRRLSRCVCDALPYMSSDRHTSRQSSKRNGKSTLHSQCRVPHLRHRLPRKYTKSWKSLLPQQHPWKRLLQQSHLHLRPLLCPQPPLSRCPIALPPQLQAPAPLTTSTPGPFPSVRGRYSIFRPIWMWTSCLMGMVGMR